MSKHIINATRLVCLVLVLAVTFMVSAQSTPDIVSSINHSGNVTISLPQGLSERANSELNKSAKAGKAEEKDEASVNEEKKTVDPRTKRAHTASQTIQGHSTGFRIQAFSESSASGKATAQARAKQIAMKFPQYRTYISYNAPMWRLRVGDFKTQADAQTAMSRLRSIFPQFAGSLMIVKDNINVWSR